MPVDARVRATADLTPTADLSSVERSARVDLLMRAIAGVARQVETLTQQMETLTDISAQHTRELQAHTRRLNAQNASLLRDEAVVRVFTGRSFWQRLRWIGRGL